MDLIDLRSSGSPLLVRVAGDHPDRQAMVEHCKSLLNQIGGSDTYLVYPPTTHIGDSRPWIEFYAIGGKLTANWNHFVRERNKAYHRSALDRAKQEELLALLPPTELHAEADRLRSALLARAEPLLLKLVERLEMGHDPDLLPWTLLVPPEMDAVLVRFWAAVRLAAKADPLP